VRRLPEKPTLRRPAHSEGPIVSPRVRGQLVWLSLMLMLMLAVSLTMAAPHASASASVVTSQADAPLLTCCLRAPAVIGRLEVSPPARSAAARPSSADGSEQRHVVATPTQPLERPWRGRSTLFLALDAAPAATSPDLLAHALAARDDGTPNRAPPSASALLMTGL
jgi:hypothetical protein